ncbi:MAG: MFS transporter [Azoarcus sp.]|jgi:MFS transporter (putative signal transducer)|nr:MFS transporter [Azoarcus sp.]
MKKALARPRIFLTMSISSSVSSRLSARQVLPAVAGIYISQTLLTAITTQSLPALLRGAGATLQMAGMVALWWLPWGLKFLWAPWVERWRLPAHDPRRRSRTLLLAGQWLLAGILLGMGGASLGGLLPLQTHGAWILALLLLSALVAATTDIACDGFTVEQLASQQRGWGNVAQVGGSYVGAMLGGGGFLLIVSHAGLSQALLATALAIVALSLPMLVLREPARSPAQAGHHRPSLMHALRRPQVVHGLLLLLLGSIGVRLTLSMMGPLLLDHGVSMERLGWLFGTFSVFAGLTGAFLGGALVRRAPGWRAVWLAVGLETCVLAGLAGVAVAGNAAQPLLIGLVGLMFGAMGCAWVALYSVLMGIASSQQAGVDFTLFQSADALLAAASGVAGGWLAGQWGYGACFGLAAALTMVATVTIRQYAAQAAIRGDSAHA